MVKSQPIVSIIIAFYNEQALLGRCLQSVKNQTREDFEVVLINDGSTDNSLSIAEKFRSDFTRIKIITTENSGHSQARNVGLQNASGAFLTFLDADDELEPRMVETCLTQILKEGADLLVSKFAIYSQNGQREMVAGWKDRNAKVSKAQELRPEMFNYGLSENVWAKLFKTELAKQLVFEKGLWFDDRPFLFEYLFVAQTVGFVEEPLLRIHKRDQSITRRTLEPKRLTDAHRVFELELKIAAQYGALPILKTKIAKHYLSVLMDHYLIQILEQNQIIAIQDVRQTFLAQLSLFRRTLHSENIPLTLKDTLVLSLLEAPRLLGWNLINRLLKILKKKRIQGLKKLK